MRAKIALLVVAATVFAPGWGSGETALRPDRPSDLAARILAPTFDERSADRPAKSSFTKASDRKQPRIVSIKAVLGVPQLWTYLPSGLVLALGIASASIIRRRAANFTARRAPPRLLTA